MVQWVAPPCASTPSNGSNTTHEYWDYSHPTLVLMPVTFYIVILSDATIWLIANMKAEERDSQQDRASCDNIVATCSKFNSYVPYH